MSQEDYFYLDDCLFCDQKADERSFGNHGREVESVCNCEGRKAWEKAKQNLFETERLVKLKVELRDLKDRLRNQRPAVNSIEERISSVEKQIQAARQKEIKYESDYRLQ